MDFANLKKVLGLIVASDENDVLQEEGDPNYEVEKAVEHILSLVDDGLELRILDAVTQQTELAKASATEVQWLVDNGFLSDLSYEEEDGEISIWSFASSFKGALAKILELESGAKPKPVVLGM